MEEELKCPQCHDFYRNPVLLPCCHSLCYSCARHLQEKFVPTSNNNNASTPATPKLVHSKQQQYVTNNSLVNAAKSASNLIALTTTNIINTTNSSISPQSSVSSTSTDNSNSLNLESRALSTNDLGSTSIVSDLDKLSVFSENDSGLGGLSTTTLTQINSNQMINNSSSSSCSSSSSSTSSSRPPSSYSSTSMLPTSNFKKMSSQLSLPPAPPALPAACSLYSTYLPCPKCTRMIYMDDTGVDSLTKNICLENIVDRYTETRRVALKCQMCLPNGNQNSGGEKTSKDAVYMCEQCEIYYCEDCKDAFHPMRGPLAKHSLVGSRVGRDLMNNKKKNKIKESKCPEHCNESAVFYCLLCKSACCGLCVNEDSTHLNHQIQPINSFCKSQKVKKPISYIIFLLVSFLHGPLSRTFLIRPS